MKYNYLGNSGLKVSELCVGAMTFGGVGNFSEIGNVGVSEAKELISIALDNGINFFDTADVYSSGASEEILGKALGVNRKDVIICTKFRFNAGGNGQNDDGASRYHILRACEQSLKRLNTDHIDIYMIHSMDLNTPLEETLSALTGLIKAGKVRYIGCSNFSGWYLMKALCISTRLRFERFITYQGYYSLLARELENELIPLCADQGLGIMVWSPLSGGYLSGKFSRGTSLPKGTRLGDNKKSNFIPPVDSEKTYDIVDLMQKIAKGHNASVAQVALNYILKKPAVSSVVLGTRKKEQLLDNINTTTWELNTDEIKKLDSISDSGLAYPYWHHKLTGVDPK
jgi:aryl-alcohol dehydrogenase-like predicted oxidoreductase